jgi:hypothetical protein
MKLRHLQATACVMVTLMSTVPAYEAQQVRRRLRQGPHRPLPNAGLNLAALWSQSARCRLRECDHCFRHLRSSAGPAW